MGNAPNRMELIALAGLPEVASGDDLASLIADAMKRQKIEPGDGDVLVIAQKIVSKAEGLVVDLTTVEPSAKALALAEEIAKDARLVELVLRESNEIVARRPGVLIVCHVSGAILANAGIDHSNVDPGLGTEPVTLLPRDPDALAANLRQRLNAICGADLGVIICDSMGRPWRLGVVGFALGVSGLAPLHDHRGRGDRHGRTLEISVEAVADELSAAAGLLMGQADESVPAVLIRGFERQGRAGSGKDLLRPVTEDLFR